VRITDYFVPKAPDYAYKLLDRIELLALLLADQPGLGAPVAGTPYRKLVIPRTDYILLYKATRHEIIVARVRHTKEDWRPL
jgi:plasmid stabilization system protein ParE